jgi:hypothetical protein
VHGRPRGGAAEGCVLPAQPLPPAAAASAVVGAVQVEFSGPIALESACFQPLNLKCDLLDSTFAFKRGQATCTATCRLRSYPRRTPSRRGKGGCTSPTQLAHSLGVSNLANLKYYLISAVVTNFAVVAHFAFIFSFTSQRITPAPLRRGGGGTEAGAGGDRSGGLYKLNRV